MTPVNALLAPPTPAGERPTIASMTISGLVGARDSIPCSMPVRSNHPRGELQSE